MDRSPAAARKTRTSQERTRTRAWIRVVVLPHSRSPPVLPHPLPRWPRKRPSPTVIQFHGYGEFHYNNPQIGTMVQSAISEADVHRFVLGWTYEFAGHPPRRRNRLRARRDGDRAGVRAHRLRPHARARACAPGTCSCRSARSMSFTSRPASTAWSGPTWRLDPSHDMAGDRRRGRRAIGGGLAYRAYVVTGLDASCVSAPWTASGGAAATGPRRRPRIWPGWRAWSTHDRRAQPRRLGVLRRRGPGGFHPRRRLVGIADGDARFRRYGFDLRGVLYQVFLDGDELSPRKVSPSGSP